MLLKSVKAGEKYQAIWSSPLTFATVEVIEIGLERRDCTGEMQNDGLNCQIIDLRIDSRSKGSSEFTAGG